jgi:site-specific DNA-methyltransferase (adenine-specific)
MNTDIDVKNMDGLKYMETIDDMSIDLILVDPPYITSRETGMDTHYNKVKYNEENDIEYVKTEYNKIVNILCFYCLFTIPCTKYKLIIT